MSEQSPMTVTEPSLGISITPAPGWARIDPPADELGFNPLVLAPESWSDDFGFRPSLTIVGVEHGDEGVPSAHLAGTEALAAVIVQPHTRVLSYDLWLHPEAIGRVMRAALAEGDQGLVTLQWVMVLDEVRLTLTGMVDVDRYLRVAPLIEQMVTSLQVGDQVSAPVTQTEEPRRDDYLAQHGEDLEDLANLPAAQPFTPGEITLGRESLLAFARVRRGRVKAGEQVQADLLQAGLVDEGGRLSADGDRVASMMREPQATVTVEAAVGLLPLSLQAWSRDGWTLIACTAPAADWLDQVPHGEVLAQAPQRMQLVWVPSAVAPMTVASWVGLGPAWSLDLGEAVLPSALVTDRVGDPTLGLPSGQSEHLQRAWAQPWSAWTLRSSDPQLGLAMINAGASGQLAIHDEDDERVRLVSVPSVMVWDVLVQVFS